MTVKVDEIAGQPNRAQALTGRRFEELFRQHWERVCAVLYRLVEDRDEAEDLAVEVFLRLHRRPPRELDAEKLHGWLYRVATNLGYNALRARSRRQKYETRAGLQENTLERADPAAEWESEEARRRVRQTLSRMPARAARLLVMRHSGLSYAEIAAALQVPVGSVGTMLARAETKFERRYRRLEGEI